jgi:hypothetical protein
VKQTIGRYIQSWLSTIGCTPLECHINGKYENTEFYKMVLEHIVKYRENFVKTDKLVNFQVMDRVNIVPRKKVTSRGGLETFD